MSRRTPLLLVGALLVALLATVPAASAERAGTRLTLVAYSTPADAFATIIPAFQATAAGRGVSFDQSYGPSEDQMRAVIAGLPTDVVDLSLQPDMETLVQAGLVSPAWNRNATKGFVTRSVVVFVLRKGNPKHIRTWDDLVRPSIGVVTPNPFTSGGAPWNVMAAYGAMLREGKTPAQARSYLATLFSHVVSQDKSARDALQTFLAGRGDVLLTYENEAILAQQKGQPVYYLIPKATIRIENPVAVVATSRSPAARAFVSFLTSPRAQTLFAEAGYRPVLASVYRKFAGRFPPRPQLFTIAYVGGWAAVTRQFFDPQTGIVAKIERGLGVSGG